MVFVLEVEYMCIRNDTCLSCLKSLLKSLLKVAQLLTNLSKHVCAFLFPAAEQDTIEVE